MASLYPPFILHEGEPTKGVVGTVPVLLRERNIPNLRGLGLHQTLNYIPPERAVLTPI
jgi:hypothetical protein